MRAILAIALLLALQPTSARLVFASSEGGYTDFRIPALVALSDQTLIAFAEGRYSHSDWGEVDTVAKVSRDAGATWGALQKVCARGTNCGNPTAVAVDNTRAILWVGEYDADLRGPGPTRRLMFFPVAVVGSQLEVQPPRDMTAMALPGPLFDALGPGAGFKTSNGTLVIPARRRYFTSVDGETWTTKFLWNDHDQRLDGTIESAMIETPNGCLLRADRPREPNDRTQGYFRATLTRKCPGEAYWQPYWHAEELAVPGHRCSWCAEDAATCECANTLYCQVSLITDASSTYFVSPSSTRERSALAVWQSSDDGDSWLEKTIILPGSAGYSSSAIAGGDLSVLVESRHVKLIGCEAETRWEISLVSSQGS